VIQPRVDESQSLGELLDKHPARIEQCLIARWKPRSDAELSDGSPLPQLIADRPAAFVTMVQRKLRVADAV